MRWKGFLATTIATLLATAAPAAASTFTVTDDRGHRGQLRRHRVLERPRRRSPPRPRRPR